MHQPMQGAGVQGPKKNPSFYDKGWNYYTNGLPFSNQASSESSDYEEGWLDCRMATKLYGDQKEM